MFDELPFRIQETILKRFPIKSLIQFRSVSKAWKSLIDSSEFIAAHSVSHTQPQHLLVSYTDTKEAKYVSFVEDDSFPKHRFLPSLPLSVRHQHIVGSSYGLLCFKGYQFSGSSYSKTMAVLLNPSIRKSIAIAVICYIRIIRSFLVLEFVLSLLIPRSSRSLNCVGVGGVN
ncbi:unnamed protein product [Lactuca saligna]|uniref:F-box domain-containing protein n=1 Tax=Lactuca saligna TaxID=75948 RepID=A0AA35VXN4_LACSI|nr:unnamed protein product [Lactuca saligna]